MLYEVITKNSYQRFLQAELPPSARQNIGLEAVFRSVFPIKDFSETCSLEYVEYVLGTPKYDVEECHQRGMTFASPMKVKVRLVSWDIDKESGVQSIRDIKEQEVVITSYSIHYTKLYEFLVAVPTTPVRCQIAEEGDKLLRIINVDTGDAMEASSFKPRTEVISRVLEQL